VDLDDVKGTGCLLTSVYSASHLLRMMSLDFLNSSNLLWSRLSSDFDDEGSGTESSTFSSSTSCISEKVTG